MVSKLEKKKKSRRMVKTTMTGATHREEYDASSGTSQLQVPTTNPGSIENPTLQITIHKLNGCNFLKWSQSVKLFIRVKGKLGYLIGANKAPKPEDHVYQTWDSENSMVMAWLINSMETAIGQTYLFLPTAKDLWDEVQETYSDLGNATQMFEIKTKLKDIKQGSHSVTQYYNILPNAWQELDLFSNMEWKCAEDNAHYCKILEKERAFDFLAGLNKELDEVRGQILGKEPLPSVREIFSEVRREKSRPKVTLGEQQSSQSETSALVIHGEEAFQPNDQQLGKKGDCPWCENC